MTSLKAVVRDGKIESLEPIELPEGTRLLVTPLFNAAASFWPKVSEVALDKVWGNSEDDVYADLLQE